MLQLSWASWPNARSGLTERENGGGDDVEMIGWESGKQDREEASLGWRKEGELGGRSVSAVVLSGGQMD